MDEREKVVSFISTILHRRRIKQGEPIEFLIEANRITKNSSPDVRKYISKIYKKAAELQALQSTVESASAAEKKKVLAQQRGIRKWLASQLKEIEKK